MVAACAKTPSGVHRCMAELARPPERTAIEIAIDHDAEADATSNSFHQKMLKGLTSTEEFLINRQASASINLAMPRHTPMIFSLGTPLS